MSETAPALFPLRPNRSASPASVLARMQFASLEEWLYSQEVSGMDLNSVELGEELRGRELLRFLLQAHVESRGDGYVGPWIEVFDNEISEVYSHKRLQERKIITLFGEISVNRLGYGKRGRISIHPLDEQLQLPMRRYSYELQRRLVRRAVQGPFDEAIDSLCETTGVKIPKRTAEEILIDASMDFEAFYERRQGNSKDETGSILVGSVDCKGIPMIRSELAPRKVRRKKGEKPQKKKMAIVAAVFTQHPYIRTPEEVVESLFKSKEDRAKKRNSVSKPQKKRVWASLETSKDSFICNVHEEMKCRDRNSKKIHVVVTDGERALQHRVMRIIKDATLILDLLHVLEKLWMAGHTLYGEDTQEAEDFVRQRCLRILRGGVSQVVKGLRQIITKKKLKGKKQEKLDGIAGYLYRNRRRMRYNEYLNKGLPIASGSVEGACKNLIKDRMERSGMRWSREMAEAMVKMRAIYLSGDFNEYWDYHVSRDQDRTYPKNRWDPITSSS
jgi:hypothetical protein